MSNKVFIAKVRSFFEQTSYSILSCDGNSVSDIVIVTVPRKSARLTPRIQCDTSGALLYNLHKLSSVLCSSLTLLHSISYRTGLKSFRAEMKPSYFSYINSDNHSPPSHLEKSYTTQKSSSSFKKLIFIFNRMFCYNVRPIKIHSKGLIQN